MCIDHRHYSLYTKLPKICICTYSFNIDNGKQKKSCSK